MVSAAGGVAYADYRLRVFDDAGDRRDSLSESRTGWTVGVGLEHAFTDSWVGRIDYRYSDFGRANVRIDEGDGVYPARVRLTTNEIRVGVAIRF